jgi:hypothetical protein
MGVVISVINPANLFGHIGGTVITVAVGVSVVAASIAMGLVVINILYNNETCCGAFINERVIRQSTSSLVFNRVIQGFETSYYYNATETLYSLVQGLNDNLRENFPDTFVKVVVSGFSSTPVLNPTRRRRRRRRSINDGFGGENQDPPVSPPIRTSPMTMSPEQWTITSSSTKLMTVSTSENDLSKISSPIILEWSSTPDIDSESPAPAIPELLTTSDFDSSSLPMDQSTSTSTDISTVISSTESYSSYDSLTNIFSTFSSLFSLSTSTTSISLPTTTIPSTTLQNNDSTNCIASTFNSTTQVSLVYINGTIYFNTTVNQTITVTSIIDALGSFTPPIELVDRCRNPSSAEGVFNAALSKVEPTSIVSPSDTNFATEDSIPAAILDVVLTVTVPSTLFESTTTTTTTTTTTITPTTTTESVTPFIG